MDSFKRYAIYHAPRRDGATADFASFGADWLGRSAEGGVALPRPVIDGLTEPATRALTEAPRKYGLHATIKAPFRLADGRTQAGLVAALEGFCATEAPVRLAGLVMARLGGFLALIPQGDTSDLNRLAARTVADFDAFRAPLTPADVARRNPDALTEGERDNLHRWGYPYVMEAFRFHMTLTGSLPDAVLSRVETGLAPHLSVVVPRPYIIEDLCLFGEDEAGLFHVLHRAALAG